MKERLNLRVAEKEDLPLVAEWRSNPNFFNHAPFPQRSKAELEKQYDSLPSDSKWFIVEKKNSSKIGFVYHELMGSQLDIGYALLSSERNKGYGTEAITIIIDYLFLAKPVVRIQATTDVRNEPSQRVLEKNEFKREGTIRKAGFVRARALLSPTLLLTFSHSPYHTLPTTHPLSLRTQKHGPGEARRGGDTHEKI